MTIHETRYLKILSRIVGQCAVGQPFDTFHAKHALDQLNALAYYQGHSAVTAAFDKGLSSSTMDPVEQQQFATQLANLIEMKDSIEYLSVMLLSARQLHGEADDTTNLALGAIAVPNDDGDGTGYPVFDAIKQAFLEGCRGAIASANSEDIYLGDIANRVLSVIPAEDNSRSLLNLEKPAPKVQLYSGSTRPELEQLGAYYDKVVAALRNDMPRVLCQRWRLHPVVIAWGAENDWNVWVGFVNRTGELRSDNCINIPPPWIFRKEVADLKDCTESRDGHFMSYVPLTDWQRVDHRKYDAYEHPLSLEVLAENINYYRLVPNCDFVDGILNDAEFGRAVSGLSWKLLDKDEHNVTLERTEQGDETYRFTDEFRQDFAITSPATSSIWELSIDDRVVRRFHPSSERCADVRQAVLDLAELSATRQPERHM